MEEWRDIEGYEGKYMVSNMGKVKSLDYHRTGKEKILRPGKDRYGYLYVILWKNNKQKIFLVHRLVAYAFIDNPENKKQIDHINTIRYDNRVDNLHWVTHKENMNNPISRKRFLDNSPIVKLGKEHTRSKAVYQYSLEGKLIRMWYCIRDVERELGFDHASISKCCLNKQKTSQGYQWKYA